MAADLNPAQRAAVEHEPGRCSSSPAPARARRASSPIASRASSSAASPRACILRDDLHEQGRRRDARARRHRKLRRRGKVAQRRSSSPRSTRFGLDVLGRETRALGSRRHVHDLRSGRLHPAPCSEILQPDPTRARATTSPRSWRASRTRRTRSSTPDGGRPPSARATTTTRSRSSSTRATRAALRELPGLRLRRSRLRGGAPLARRARRPRALAERYRYVIVDEYQDTNHAQLELCGCSAASTGTSASSATTTSRSTRGAAPTCATSSTSRSISPARRSSSSSRTTARRAAILAVANAVIAKRGARRHDKTLFADARGRREGAGSSSPPIPRSRRASSAREMRRLHRAGAAPAASDFAVLYRSNVQAKPPRVERSEGAAIPYPHDRRHSSSSSARR